MRSSFIYFFLVCLFLESISAQDYTTLGKPGTETFQNIIVLNNGDLAISGKTRAQGAGSDDMYLTIFTTNGEVKYCKTYGQAKSDIPFALTATKNGELLMAGQGYDELTKLGASAIIYRLDRFGNKIWKRVLSGRSAYTVTELDNGNIAVGGYQNADYSLTILDPDGAILLEKAYGTEYKDYAFGLVETSDGGYLLGGIKAGFHSPEGHDMNIPDADLIFIKIGTDGTEQWRKEEGTEGHDFLADMQMDQEGNIYIVGSTQGDGDQSFDAFLLKMDQQGNILWKELLGGTDFEYGLDLIIDENKNTYICGVTNSSTVNDNPDLFAAKFNAEGNNIWYKQMGSSASEYANGITINSNQEIILIGSSTEDNETDYLMAKLDTNGDLLGLNPLPNQGQILLLSQNPTTDFITLGVETNLFCQEFTYTLYNVKGQQLSQQKAEGTTVLDLRSLVSGMYFVEVLLDDGTVLTEKIIKK